MRSTLLFFVFCFSIFLVQLSDAKISDSKESDLEMSKISQEIKKITTKMNLNLMNFNDFRSLAKLPSPIVEKEKIEMNIWSVHCPPCMLKLKNSWKNSSAAWVSIDQEPGERLKALDWMAKNKIDIVAYQDADNYFKKSFGKKLVLPLTLNIKKGHIVDVSSGYKVTGTPEETADRIMLNL